MEFKYRYVGFGTRFAAAPGERPDAAPEAALHENELAVDVGGVCWGHDGERRPVLDHHFARPVGQFPSAAAAVLHNAARIRAHWDGRRGDFWLVSHGRPDFDAYSAMYLARAVLRGDIPHDGWDALDLHPDGWLPAGGGRRIDWFRPDVRGLGPQRRWPVLLAACASCVDNCKRLFCPPSGALHSVLYAALQRGRDYAPSGAVEFFEVVREALSGEGNPLYDSVLEGDGRFAAELSLLARDEAAYRRDLAKARRTVVFLKRAGPRAGDWYAAAQAQPLADGRGALNRAHVDLPGHGYRQADGLFLRDPESLLFKEWARADTENSSMGEGFLFTAIAYSGGRGGPGGNATDYYFSLDPEQAAGAHLYNVWARLQHRELEALHDPDDPYCVAARAEWDARPAEQCPPRPGYAGRAAGPYARCFTDPWFDGSNYGCTLVATPNGGTLLRPGLRRDLGDDEAARLVEEELHAGFFTGAAEVEEFSAGPAGPDGAADYRFVRVALHEEVQVRRGGLAEQVGRVLWGKLHPGADVPPDFRERHLVYSGEWVGVWSRRGVAVAYRPEAAAAAEEFRRLVRELAALSREELELIGRMQAGAGGPPPADVLRTGEDLLLRVARIKHDLALPDSRLVSRFFEASGLTEVLRTLRDVYLAATEKAQTETLNRNIGEMTDIQRGLHLVEVFIVSVYAVELAHLVGHAFGFGGAYLGVSLLAIAALVMVLAAVLMHAHGRGKRAGARLRLALAAGAAVLAAYLALGFVFRPAEPTAPAAEMKHH